MLSEDQGGEVVRYAREVVEARTSGEETPEPPEKDFFGEKKGVFVTLNKNDDLRGCIGITQPEYTLSEAIKRAASSCIQDPRFPPLEKGELDKVTVEVTVLTEPELIDVENPEEYVEKIEIGRDGLLIKRGPSQGLLLPQVPVEQSWNAEEFLNGLCQKAGLTPNTWKDDSAKIYRFQGQIFAETSPNGEVREREIT